jgi:hypothetical protein
LDDGVVLCVLLEHHLFSLRSEVRL